MKFWDASAVVALLVAEPASTRLLALLDEDPTVVAWWGTPVECASALARLEREGALSHREARSVDEQLDHLIASWIEVRPVDSVRVAATRMLRVHSLRAADSLQLAAALLASRHDPRSLEFVSLDARLNEAARREGFLLRNS